VFLFVRGSCPVAPHPGPRRASWVVGTMDHTDGAVTASIALIIAVAGIASSSGVTDAGAAAADLAETASPEPLHDWTLHEEKHWQVVSPFFQDPMVTDAVEGTRGSCPLGMVEVRGRMRVDRAPFSIEAMQKLMCTRWISQDFPERCAEFDKEGWLSFVRPIAMTKMAFCVDRYEYPNIKGQFPWVFVTSTESFDICAERGKRLCSEEEWTFACEGEDAWPYPYGFERSSEACVIDRPWIEYDEENFADRSSRAALLELDRTWQGERSGSRAGCRSPFGVYDMTGNVDEWTQATATHGYRSILKGGYWGQVRNRCRPSTRVHGEEFAFYQQGFRCCADLPRP
jgi:sulfatase modifying factor 1